MAGQAQRSRGPRHTDPGDVTLQQALEALADPVRRLIVRIIAEEPEFARSCGTFDLPVVKATASHHFAVLRAAGVIEQIDRGSRRLSRLRRAEFDACFPGLLALILAEGQAKGQDEGQHDAVAAPGPDAGGFEASLATPEQLARPRRTA